MSEEEWDAVIQVHLKGTFALMRHAAAHWRDRFKADEKRQTVSTPYPSSPSSIGLRRARTAKSAWGIQHLA